MIPDPLVHVRQPTGGTCGQACVAMIAGVPLESVTDEFGQEMLNDRLIHLALAHFGIAAQNYHPEWSTVGIFVVPSTGILGLCHYLVYDFRGYLPRILDPGEVWTMEAIQERGGMYGIACFDRSMPTTLDEYNSMT